MKKGQHVVPATSGGWSVKKAGASRASKNFATQKEAVEAATRTARREKTEVYIHGKDGRIRERNSYGIDPNPPRG